MKVQTFLGWLVVVGYNRQAIRCAHLFCVLGLLDRLGSRVRAGPRDDRDTAFGGFDRRLDQQAMFFEVDGGRLTGRADDDDTGGAIGNVEIDQLAQAGQIELASRLHRRRNGDETSLQHRFKP